MNDSLVNSLADRLTIIELLNHFGIAIDLRDWESFHRLFAEEVEFDYSSIGEVAGTLHPDDITKTARQDLGGFQATQHVITNHQVQLSTDNATCRAHVRAMHFLSNNKSESMLEIGGYYQAGLVRIDSNWKIQSWKFTILWSNGDLKLFDRAKENKINN